MKKKWIMLLATLTMVSTLGSSVSATSVLPSAAPAVEALKEVATPAVSNDKATFIDNLNDPVQSTANDAKAALAPAVEALKEEALPSPEKVDDILSENGLLSTTIPSSFWNLNSLGDYRATFSGVRNVIFTNYYFPTSNKGELYVRGNVTEDYPHEGYYSIDLFELGSYKRVVTYKAKANGYTGVRFYNLDSKKNYFFGFTHNSDNTISGTFTISQD